MYTTCRAISVLDYMKTVGQNQVARTGTSNYIPYIYGLVQDRRNSTANALELRLSCTLPWYNVGVITCP